MLNLVYARLVSGLSAKDREKFDHMLNAPTADELKAIAARAIAEATAVVKVAPSWWDD